MKTLKRLQDILSEKETPTQIVSDLTNQYIADIKAKAKADAEQEIKQLLIKSAESAETEGLTAKIEGLERENAALQSSVDQAKSQIAQLTDFVKSLQANISELEAYEPMEQEPCGHEIMMAGKDARIQDLEQKLLNVKPVIQANPVPISFEFEPVRNENGLIRSVTAKPIYRN